MAEQVIDIRERIEKMRIKFEDDHKRDIHDEPNLKKNVSYDEKKTSANLENDFENQQNNDSSNWSSGSNSSSGGDVSLSQILGVGALILVAAIAMVVWEMLIAIWAFTVAYWPWLLGGSVLLFVLWAVFIMDDEDEES